MIAVFVDVRPGHRNLGITPDQVDFGKDPCALQLAQKILDVGHGILIGLNDVVQATKNLHRAARKPSCLGTRWSRGDHALFDHCTIPASSILAKVCLILHQLIWRQSPGSCKHGHPLGGDLQFHPMLNSGLKKRWHEKLRVAAMEPILVL